MLHFLYAFFITILLLPNTSLAGPFGTNMGDTVESLQKTISMTKYKEGVWTSDKLPKSHSSFEEYILYFGESGLAQIIAISEEFDNDRYGASAKRCYSKLKEQLSEKYGTPRVMERLSYDATWDASNEFVASIYKNERAHGAMWNNLNIDNLDEIILMISANSFSSCKVQICYKYKNYKDIEKKEEDNDKNSL